MRILESVVESRDVNASYSWDFIARLGGPRNGNPLHSSRRRNCREDRGFHPRADPVGITKRSVRSKCPLDFKKE